MPDEYERHAGTQAAPVLEVPAAVRAAWLAAPSAPAAGQIRRALWHDVARFVVVLNVEGRSAEVAPISLEPDLASDEAYLLEGGESDLGVRAAIWLGLKNFVPVRVLERSPGVVHLPVELLRKLPTGPAIQSVLDPRSEEKAELADDMAELAAAPADEVTLKDLLVNVTGSDMRAAGLPPQLVLALRRGHQRVTSEQAELIAPLAGVAPAELLKANPALPDDLLRDLDSVEGRRWVTALAEERQLPLEDSRLTVGYGAYALAAREERRTTIWTDRIEHYVRSRLSDG